MLAALAHQQRQTAQAHPVRPSAFPTATAQQPGEDRREYGTRVLAWIPRTPPPIPGAEPVLAGYSAEAQDAAERAAYAAVTARDILPAAVDRIAAARRAIARTLALRAQMDAEDRARLAEQLTRPAAPTPVSNDDARPGGGYRVAAPRTPPPTQPPTGSAALRPGAPTAAATPAAPAPLAYVPGDF